MSKAMLHSLIDQLSDSDTETIYRVLLKFIPETDPLPDEIESYNIAMKEIENGETMRLEDIDWDAI